MISIKKALEQIAPKTIIDIFKNKYSHLKKEDLENILEQSNKISNKIIENPGKIFLLLGQIQSGKTASYLSIISQMFDKGSNFVFILPAIDNILFNQTIKRFKSTFDNSRIEIFTINSIFKKNINTEKINRALKNQKKVILFSLKNSKRLENSVQVLEDIKHLITKPLFIDDEGDQASFDNQNLEKASTIHSKILQIYKSHNLMSFLTVTASPMPHVLVSKSYKIKPDFAFYIKPGIDYLGIDQFINNENKYIEIVDDKENEFFFKKNKATSPSFTRSLLSFFVAASLIHLRDEKFSTQSMLLHIDRKILQHETIQKITSSCIEKIKTEISENTDKVKDDILDILKQFSKEAPKNFKDFLTLILAHIENCRVIVINNQNNTLESIEALHAPRNKNYLYIGSNMLQRGITIKNLLHTYFTYRPQSTLNADTVLQRARWFGYQKNKDLIKVFMNEMAILDFQSLFLTIPNIIERIERLEENLLPFGELERKLLIPNLKMQATRNSVINNTRKVATRVFSDNSTKSSIYAEKLFNEIEQMKTTTRIIPDMPFRGSRFTNFKDFVEWTSNEIVQLIFDELIREKSLIKIFNDFISQNKPDFYIVNMYTEKNSFRERTSTKNLVTLMQGPSQNQNYIGDRYWYKHKSQNFKNSVFLQLFKVKINKNEIIYKYALVCPLKIYDHFVYAEDKHQK